MWSPACSVTVASSAVPPGFEAPPGAACFGDSVRKAPASASALSSSSSCRRSSASLPQAPARNASLSPAGNFSASLNRASTFSWFALIERIQFPFYSGVVCRQTGSFHPNFFDPRLGRPAQLGKQPGPGKGPVTLGRGRRDAQGAGGILDGQPGEESELDQLCLLRCFAGQLVQCFIDSQQ